MKKFTLLMLLAASISSYAQNWFPLGSGLDDNQRVKAMVSYNGKLIIGGSFGGAGGVADANAVAAWDGSNWTALEKGFDDEVRALVVYNNELYAGGTFNANNDNTVNLPGKIAKWNGSAWVAVAGADPDNTDIRAMYVWNNKLYITNNRYDNTTSSVKPVISVYDGSTWTTLPDNFKGPQNYCYLYGISSYGDSLVVCGTFDSVGTVHSERVAFYDGTNWVSSGLPGVGRFVLSGTSNIILSGRANAAIEKDGNLYVGGLLSEYPTSTDTINPNLVKFDGTTWTPLPWNNNTSGSINDFEIINDSLFILGSFAVYNPSNVLCAGCVYFDDTQTYPFINMNYANLSTAYNEVLAGAVYNGELHIGGRFTHVGTNTAKSVARLDANAVFSDTELFEEHKNNSSLYPNPATDHISITAPDYSTVSVTLFDITGREILKTDSKYIATNNIERGTYFVEVTTEGVKEVHKLVLK